MLMNGNENWAPNRSKRRETETAEMRLLRSVSGYTLTGHAPNTSCYAMQVYALEEITQDYKNK
jgi:hypothetical protein